MNGAVHPRALQDGAAPEASGVPASGAAASVARPETAPRADARGTGEGAQGTAPAPTFSLVLATVNRSTELATFIDSLLRQTERDYELIVVDQNDDDRIEPFLEPARRAGVRLQRLRTERRGLSHARNVGLAAATGAIVAFPDDDCWYEPDVLAKVRRLMTVDGELDGVVVRWLELEQYFKRTWNERRLDLGMLRSFRSGVVTSISIFVSRERVERIGRFDRRLGVGSWYGAAEETDLVLRLLETGARIEYERDVVVHHPCPPRTLTEFSIPLCQLHRQRERGIGAMYAKHRMSAWVVVRGLVAPLVRPFRSDEPFENFVRGLFGTLGRVEGMVRWMVQERRS